MKNQLLFLTALCLIIFSCNQGEKFNPNALTEAYDYFYEPVGWSAKVPAGWELMGEEELDAQLEKGDEMIQGVLDMEVDYTGMKNLLDFKYDDLNVFGSSTEPFLEEYPGEYEEANNFVREVLSATYTNENMNFKMFPTEVETVDGIDFEAFRVEFYNENDDWFMEQQYFSALINGCDFSVNLTFTDRAKGEEMLEIWRASTFDVPRQSSPEEVANEEVHQQFLDCIAKADDAFSKDQFQVAKNWYVRAKDIKPSAIYSEEQIEKCDSLLRN